MPRKTDDTARGHVRVPTLVALVLCLAVAAAPVRAEQGRLTLRGAALYLLSTSDEAGTVTVDGVVSGGNDTQEISDGPGLGVEVEYMFRPKWGLELGVLTGYLDAELTRNRDGGTVTASEDFDFTSVSLGVNYHFTPAGRADWYAGLYALSYQYEDITLDFPDTPEIVRWTLDEDYGFGFKAGVDMPFGTDGRWLFGAGVRQHRGPLDIKPIIPSLGVGYRF